MIKAPLTRAERDHLARRIRSMRRLRTEMRRLTMLVEQLRDDVEGVAATHYAATHPEIEEELNRIAGQART